MRKQEFFSISGCWQWCVAQQGYLGTQMLLCMAELSLKYLFCALKLAWAAYK